MFTNNYFHQFLFPLAIHHLKPSSTNPAHTLTNPHINMRKTAIPPYAGKTYIFRNSRNFTRDHLSHHYIRSITQGAGSAGRRPHGCALHSGSRR
jgi:hypothetical protein